MTTTNPHFNILRSALVLFAIGFALLSPPEARAQLRDEGTRSLINRHTGTALSNGASTLPGATLSTSIWVFGDRRQQWRFFGDPNSMGRNLFMITTLMGSTVDVLAHSVLPGYPAIQNSSDNSLFQRWEVIRIFGTGMRPNTIGWFWLKNGGSGLCLTDYGSVGAGGTWVAQQTCDVNNPRQLWAMWAWSSAAVGETGGSYLP